MTIPMLGALLTLAAAPAFTSIASTVGSTCTVARSIAELTAELRALGEVEELSRSARPPISLGQLLESVDRAYPEILRLARAVDAAQGKRLAAAGIFDPKVLLDLKDTPAGFYDTTRMKAEVQQLLPLWGIVAYGGYRQASGNLPIYYLEDETLDGGELRLGMRLPTLQGGSIDEKRAKLAAAGWRQRISEEDLRAQRIAFFRVAAALYWGWVANVETYRVQRELLRLSELRDAQIERKVERGALPSIDRLENLRALLARRERVIQARRSVERAAISLSLFLRNADGRPTRPSPEQATGHLSTTIASSEGPIEIGIERALRKRPEARRAVHELQEARVALRLADNRRLPVLDLVLEMSKDLGAGTEDQLKSLDPTVVKLGAKLSFPLFFRAGRGESAAARAKVEAAKLKARLVREKIEAEVRDAGSRVEAFQQATRTNLLGLRAAKAAAQAELRRFELGATSLLIVNLREQAAASAEVKLLETLKKLHIATFDWGMFTMREDAVPPPNEPAP